MYLYMFIYNLTIVSLFWIYLSIVTKELKTLHSFSLFGFDPFYLFSISLYMFSMAGVPPFIGFFTKLFLVIFLFNYNFYFLYFILFIILFTGLYFYIQNIRFIHSSNTHNSNKTFFLGQERILFLNIYFLIFINFILINGVFYIDDVLLFFSWIFS